MGSAEKYVEIAGGDHCCYAGGQFEADASSRSPGEAECAPSLPQSPQGGECGFRASCIGYEQRHWSDDFRDGLRFQPRSVALTPGTPAYPDRDLAVALERAADNCKRSPFKASTRGERVSGILRDDAVREAATVDAKQVVWGKELSHFMKALKAIAMGKVTMLRTVLSTRVELASGEDTP